jgi:protocatechuate 3,4-dioxygenase beta subunit
MKKRLWNGSTHMLVLGELVMPSTPDLGFEASPLRLGRRAVLGAVIAGISTPLLAQTEPLTRRGTPQLTLGPFYPLNRPGEEDADLTRVAGAPEPAYGTIIRLSGRVMNEAGQPVPGARIDTWQTNGYGAYHHPSDQSGKPRDPGFQGGAIFIVDAHGRYTMRTVMPLPYASRQRHIHFDVSGRNRRLMTQLFFPGEPNDKDFLYQSLRSPSLQAAVTASRIGQADGVADYSWDIRLSGE